LYQNLLPKPLSIQLLGGERSTTTIQIDAADLLNDHPAEALTECAAILLYDWISTADDACTVKLLAADAELDFSDVPPAVVEQAYHLVVGDKITLQAMGVAGFRHGLATLRQILEDGADQGRIPLVEIRDWPAIKWRGVHFDLAREMEFRAAYLRTVIERLAYLKINQLHLYLENNFVYPSCPEVAPKGAMTPQEARELVAYAAGLGVTVVPQIPTLGHMGLLLQGERRQMREDPEIASNICPTHPKTRAFLAGLIADVTDVFQSPFVHLGYDESHSGHCARCMKGGGPERILAEHLNWLNEQVRSHGAVTMIYGDMFLAPEQFPKSDSVNGGRMESANRSLQEVTRDIIITDWHYISPYGNTVEHFVKQGFVVHGVCASNGYWHDTIAFTRGHHWIVDTIDRAIAQGAEGCFNSNWEFYRGQFFENFWFLQALAAERMWYQGTHDFSTYCSRFTHRFWGLPDERFSHLMALIEATSSNLRLRKRYFLDGPDHRVLGEAGIFDQHSGEETGEYILEQVSLLKTQVRRNEEMLDFLDIYGLISLYIGVRVHARAVIDFALKRDATEQVDEAIGSVVAAAERVMEKLDFAFRRFGTAVEDRGRLRSHIRLLQDMSRRVHSPGFQGLAIKTTEELEDHVTEQQ
jgi:hypothetical protein